MDQPIWLTFLVAFIFMNVLLVGMAYMTWYERKVLAAMLRRVVAAGSAASHSPVVPSVTPARGVRPRLDDPMTRP